MVLFLLLSVVLSCLEDKHTSYLFLFVCVCVCLSVCVYGRFRLTSEFNDVDVGSGRLSGGRGPSVGAETVGGPGETD